jgi:hypothetical protein
MTNLDHHRRATTRRQRARRISDGVVASYIHDISERHRDREPAHRPQSFERTHSFELRRPVSHRSHEPAFGLRLPEAAL